MSILFYKKIEITMPNFYYESQFYIYYFEDIYEKYYKIFPSTTGDTLSRTAYPTSLARPIGIVLAC
jgi:hypothetical protein